MRAVDDVNRGGRDVGYATVVGRGYQWSTIFGISSAASILPGLPTPTQAHVGILRMLRSGAALGATMSVGLSETAADLTAGATWRVSF